ncbi:MAG: hypothetical protein ABSH20_00405 [Tepidisphaeraceae bacterium]
MKAEQLIHDSHRVPRWIGVPCFVAGIGVLLFAADIVSTRLFGFGVLPARGVPTGSPTLGFLCALGLGLFFLSVPFMRNRIFYDPEHNQVLVRHSGLFGKSQRLLPLGSATGVEIKDGRGGFCGADWSIWIQLGGGRREWLTQLGSVDEADGAARALSEAARVPLLRT